MKLTRLLVKGFVWLKWTLSLKTAFSVLKLDCTYCPDVEETDFFVEGSTIQWLVAKGVNLKILFLFTFMYFSIFRYAIRDGNKIKIFKNFKERKSFKPEFGAESKCSMCSVWTSQIPWATHCVTTMYMYMYVQSNLIWVGPRETWESKIENQRLRIDNNYQLLRIKDIE